MMTMLFRAGRWALSGLLVSLVACQSAPTDAQLLRLRLLDEELMAMNSKTAAAHNQLVKEIRTAVEKNHNQPKDVEVLKQSIKYRSETQQMVAYLRGLRLQLCPTGPAPTLAQLADRRIVAEVLLNSGRIDSLQRRLSRFTTSLQPYGSYGTHPPLGAAGADPRVRDVVGKGMAGEDFWDFYFEDASVATALAVLAQQEAGVLWLESDVQTELSKKVGGCFVFDKIGAIAVAESNTVKEGDTYRAQLFITASASGQRPRMTLNGHPLAIGPDGKGRVALTAPVLAPGQNRQTTCWDGTISIRNNGRDTTLQVRVPYTIVRRR